jgi:hypothetical protein
MSNLTERITELTEQIQSLSNERTRLLQDWAQEVSPWTVGDITRVHGYSFSGKQCRILTVTGQLAYNGTRELKVTARILKQDGSDSAKGTDWTWKPEGQL